MNRGCSFQAASRDVGGSGLGGGLAPAQQNQHSLNMRHIGGADVRNARVAVEIEVPLGQSQPTLPDLRGDDPIVLPVLVDPKPEQNVAVEGLQGKSDIEHLGERGCPIDARQLPIQGPRACALSALSIHGGSPEIPDLALVAACRRRGGDRSLVELAQGVRQLFPHEEIDAPAMFGGRNGIAFQPAAVRVLEEVIPGTHRGVAVGHQEVGHRRRLHRLGTARPLCCTHEHQQNAGILP
jgi:hypothetical protein